MRVYLVDTPTQELRRIMRAIVDISSQTLIAMVALTCTK